MCYELEVERNGGDWRIRSNPAQKGLNGKPPVATEETRPEFGDKQTEDQVEQVDAAQQEQDAPSDPPPPVGDTPTHTNETTEGPDVPKDDVSRVEAVNSKLAELSLGEEADGSGDPAEAISEEDDDSDGWITPSNLKKHQAKDSRVAAPTEAIQETLQAALLTSDFAMQNVALRINLKYVQ